MAKPKPKPRPTAGGGSPGPGNNPRGGAGQQGLTPLAWLPGGGSFTYDIATGASGEPVAPGQGDYHQFAPQTAPGQDWVSLFWGSLGLDTATIAGLTKAISGLTDPTQIQTIGQNYLRSTPWYQQTFPGFAAGVQAGLYTDESGYRQYVGQLNQATQQYLGQAVTGAQVTAALSGGISANVYAQLLQGDALAKTLGPEAQYEAGAFDSQGRLSDQELQAYGREKAGYDTPLGQAVSQRLQNANQRMQTLFSGTLARANLSLGPQGVYSSSLQNAAQRGAQQAQPDLPAT